MKEVENVTKEGTMERILNPNSIDSAWERVRSNGGSGGVDGRNIDETFEHLRKHWRGIEESLRAGRYVPSPVLGIKIPKGSGGERLLGIPTVQDRIIQQALHQMLTESFDHLFSNHSYGFRPKRSAHNAVKTAQDFVLSGKNWVVDIDISSFFDCVNHDILMGQLMAVEDDRRVLGLIRKYLKTGMVIDGKLIKRKVGTPQGGPLSPLLANVYLDRLDKELESRGLSFCRYADDVNIYVSSERSATRVLESIVAWIEKHLKLTVNASKSGVGRPWERQFLGFTIRESGDLDLSPRSEKRYKERIRSLWNAEQNLTTKGLIEQWQNYIRGWWNYFRLTETAWRIRQLEGWTRRHIRKCFWLRWHNWKGRLNKLRRLGAKTYHQSIAWSSRGAWRIANSPALKTVLKNSLLRNYGLTFPSDFSAK